MRADSRPTVEKQYCKNKINLHFEIYLKSYTNILLMVIKKGFKKRKVNLS